MTPFEVCAWLSPPLAFGFFAWIIVSTRRLARQIAQEKQQADAQRGPPQAPDPEEPVHVRAVIIFTEQGKEVTR